MSGAGYEESVVICKLGGPRRRVWELSGLGVVKRMRRSTNCVPNRVWKADRACVNRNFIQRLKGHRPRTPTVKPRTLAGMQEGRVGGRDTGSC